jgi:hypothetical protein
MQKWESNFVLEDKLTPEQFDFFHKKESKNSGSRKAGTR